MDFITLDAALAALADRVTAPQGDELAEAARTSEAAGLLRQMLRNVSQGRPRWVERNKIDGKPEFNDAAISHEGMEMLEHTSGWYGREIKNRTDHVCACLNNGLDPNVEPMGHNLNDGQYPSALFFRPREIGFDRGELVAFLEGKIDHNLKPLAEPVAINSSTPCNPPQPARPEDTSRNRAQLQAVPVAAGSASGGVKPAEGGPGWSLKSSLERAPGYRWPLYQVLKAAHIAGKPRPKARDVLNIWELKPPPDVQVMPDGVKYNDGLGNPKEANLKAIQQAIKGLLK
ncbi:MAG: hypothetical protein WAW69_06220 [Polaromonas sp.]